MNWTLDGLPMHPLLVHGAVVLLVVNAAALVGALVLTRFRRWLGWGLPTLGGLSAVMAFVAKESGENLLGDRAVSGALADHTHWGGLAGVVGIVLGVTTIIAWLSWSPTARAKAPWLAHPAVQGVILVSGVGLAIAVVALDFLAGHSGATSVWGRG